MNSQHQHRYPWDFFPPAVCFALALVGAVTTDRSHSGVGTGLLTIGLSTLPLALLLFVMGSQGFSKICRAPQQFSWVRRAFSAGALSLIGLVLLGAVVGVAFSATGIIAGLVAGPALLVVFSPLLLMHWPGFPLPTTCVMPLSLLVWFSMGFLAGAVFNRRWEILSAWLLLAAANVGMSILILIGALSH